MDNVKTYLSEIKSKRQYLQRLKDRRKNLHLCVSFGSIDYNADRVQTTPKNKMEEAAVRMSDRLEEIDAEIAKVSMEIDDRIAAIETLGDSTIRAILYKRYAEYKSFEEISIELNYTYHYTCTLHGVALKELSKYHNFS